MNPKPPGEIPTSVTGQIQKLTHEEVSSITALAPGAASQTERQYSIMTLRALQDLHARPSKTIQRLTDYFKRRHAENDLLIPLEKDGNENATRTGGFQPMSAKNLVLLGVEQGHTIDLVTLGPDSEAFAGVLRYVFNDNFARRSDGYIALFESGGMNLAAQAMTSEETLTIKDMPTGIDLRSVVIGSTVLQGTGAGTGLAVLGRAVVGEEYDYSQRFGICDKDQAEVESQRLIGLLKVMTKGRPAASGLLARLFGRKESVEELVHMREGEADFIFDVGNEAIRLLRRPLNQSMLSGRGIKITLPESGKFYANAELAVELSVDWRKYPPEERPHVDELKRSMMDRLVGGLEIRDMMAYSLGRLLRKRGSQTSFTRSGFHFLRGEGDKRYLETNFEWKEEGLVHKDRGPQIPLSKEGDGTAYVARLAIQSGRQESILVRDVKNDSRTCHGYMESNECAWATVHNKKGAVIGVLWADTKDKQPISDLMVDALRHAAEEAGPLIEMARQVSEPETVHHGEISVSKAPPVGDEVIGMIVRGWAGFASQIGNRKVHGLILAGGNRMPAVVGLGEGLDNVMAGLKPEDTVLIVDPADSRNALFVVNPKKRTLEFLGIAKIGDSISIEPEHIDISDAVTSDGFRVHLRGSLQGARPEQIARQKKYGAEGTGLFRSEFAWMNDPPSVVVHQGDKKSFDMLEQYFYDTGMNLVRTLSDPNIKIIRLLDITPKKYPDALKHAYGEDAAMRATGLKFLLQHPELLASQCRAICRIANDVPGLGDVSAHCTVGIMIPNVGSFEDLMEFNRIFTEIRDGVSPNMAIQRIPQIEDPRVIENGTLERMLPYAERFAFGTNDLTVGTLGREGRAGLGRDEFDPKVIRVLKKGIDITYQRNDLSRIICGVLSETPEGIALIIGMGVDEVSLPPRYMPEIRGFIRSMERKDCASWVETILSGNPDLANGDQVYNFIRSKIR